MLESLLNYLGLPKVLSRPQKSELLCIRMTTSWFAPSKGDGMFRFHGVNNIHSVSFNPEHITSDILPKAVVTFSFYLKEYQKMKTGLEEDRAYLPKLFTVKFYLLSNTLDWKLQSFVYRSDWLKNRYCSTKSTWNQHPLTSLRKYIIFCQTCLQEINLKPVYMDLGNPR